MKHRLSLDGEKHVFLIFARIVCGVMFFVACATQASAHEAGAVCVKCFCPNKLTHRATTLICDCGSDGQTEVDS